MAGQTVVISVLADTRKASKAFKDFSKASGLSALANGAKKLAKGLALVSAAGVVAGAAIVKSLDKAGEEMNTANDRIKAVNKTMGLFGDQADKVSNRVVKLAEKTARNTGIDNKQIKLAQAKLLTFKELAKTADKVGGAFDRATMAAIDLGAAGFGDAASNAVQLGKALNDPIAGMAALGESGVTFTETEKEMVQAMLDANDMAGAQDLVLSAIEAQVSGTAEATANGSEKMKESWAQFVGHLGQKVTPVLDKFFRWLTDTGLPIIESLASVVADNVGPAWQAITDYWNTTAFPAIKTLWSWFRDNILPVIETTAQIVKENLQGAWEDFVEFCNGKLFPTLASLYNWCKNNGDIVASLAIGIGSAIIVLKAFSVAMKLASATTALFTAVLGLNPIVLIAGAIIAAAAGLTYFFTQTERGKKAWKAITDFVTKKAVPFLKKAWDILYSAVERIINVFKFFWDILWKVGEFIIGNMVRTADFLIAAYSKAADILEAFFSKVWDGLKWLGEAGTSIWEFFRDLPAKVGEILAAPGEWLIDTGKKVMSGLWNGIQNGWKTLSDWFSKLSSVILIILKAAGNWLVDTGKRILSGLFNGISYGWSSVSSWFSSLGRNIGAILSSAGSWLVERGKAALNGLLNGIKSVWSNVSSWFNMLPSRIMHALGNLGGILIEAGKAIMSGLWNGLKSGFEKVKDFVGGIASWIKEHKGPKAYDLQLLVPAGGWILTGLMDGLKAALPDLERQLTGIAGIITGTFDDPITVGSLSAASAGPTPIHVTVNAGVGDPIAIGREVKKVISAYDRSGRR